MKPTIRKAVRSANKGSETAELKNRLKNTESISGKSIGDSPIEEPVDSDKKIGFYANDEVTEIRWDRFKSEKNRLLVRNLLKAEALRMGMVERVAEISSGLGWEETAAIYNGLTVSMVTTLTKCPLSLASVLALTQQEMDTINSTGCADRVCRKYLSTDFPYFDEIMLALMLVPILGTKFQLFSQMMKQWKNLPNKNEPPTPPTGNTGNAPKEEQVAA